MKISTCLSYLMLFLALNSVAQAPNHSNPYQKEATVTESNGVVHVVANSPRPLLQVLDALQKKYGWIVSFEDPEYTASQDLAKPSADSKVQYPSGGIFTVDFPGNAPDEGKTLQLIVDSYNRSKNPGQFELRRLPENRFDVVGIGAHDEKGSIGTQSPVLDAVVTIKPVDRNLNETLDALCQQVTQQTHTDIEVAVSPRSLLARTTSKIAGDKVQARDILVKTIAETHHNLYWQVLYDPSSRTDFLNIHSAQVNGPGH